MTESSIRPVRGKTFKRPAILTAGIGIILLGMGYLWLTRTHADFRPGMGVRLHKASVLSWSQTVYIKGFSPQESEERLTLYDNPFIESEASLDFFVQYDPNLGGVQRLVLELGGIKYHIHKRHSLLPRRRRGPRPPARSPLPLAPPESPAPAAGSSSSRPSLFQDYAIRDEGKREYLQNGEKAEPLIKRGLEIAETKLAEARAVFRKDVIQAGEKAKTRSGREPR